MADATIGKSDHVRRRTDAMTGPRGAKPRKMLSAPQHHALRHPGLVALYYILPLWVMVMTSLKGMPEIRLGNIFAPPVEITFEPWVKAWADGLHRPELRRAVARASGTRS